MILLYMCCIQYSTRQQNFSLTLCNVHVHAMVSMHPRMFLAGASAAYRFLFLNQARAWFLLCANVCMRVCVFGDYRTRETFGGGKYWRIRGNPPNFYPPNVACKSKFAYHPKVKKMCIRQYFTPPNISRVRYLESSTVFTSPWLQVLSRPYC